MGNELSLQNQRKIIMHQKLQTVPKNWPKKQQNGNPCQQGLMEPGFKKSVGTGKYGSQQTCFFKNGTYANGPYKVGVGTFNLIYFCKQELME